MVVVTAPELCRRIHAVDGSRDRVPPSALRLATPHLDLTDLRLRPADADQWYSHSGAAGRSEVGRRPRLPGLQGSDTHFSPVLKPFGSFVASKPPDMSDDRQPPADMSVTRPLPNRCLMTLPLSPTPPTPPGRLAFGEGAFPHSTLSGIALRTSTPVDSRASRHLHRVGGSPKITLRVCATPHKYVYRRGLRQGIRCHVVEGSPGSAGKERCPFHNVCILMCSRGAYEWAPQLVVIC